MKYYIIFSIFLVGAIEAMDDLDWYEQADTLAQIDEQRQQGLELIRSKKFDISVPDSKCEEIDPIDRENGKLNCSICLGEINRAKGEDYTAHCGHVFCCDCLDTWITYQKDTWTWIAHQKNCPLCRAQFTNKNELGFVTETMPEIAIEQTVTLCIPIWIYMRLLYFKIVYNVYSIRGDG